jgi:cobalt/nickel transport system permease protein
MCAILAIQALVFQDGGILALGANTLNMAVLGVLAGWLPFHLWGSGRWRRLAIFTGAALSVLVSALAAIGELFVSGVRMPASVLGVSLALFLVSAVLEGAITVTVMQAIETIEPGFARKPAARRRPAFSAIAFAAVMLAAVGVLFASTAPDGIQKLAQQAGLAGPGTSLLSSPLAGYQSAFLESGWLRKATAGLAGLVLVYGACFAIGRAASARRSA